MGLKIENTDWWNEHFKQTLPFICNWFFQTFIAFLHSFFLVVCSSELSKCLTQVNYYLFMFRFSKFNNREVGVAVGV